MSILIISKTSHIAGQFFGMIKGRYIQRFRIKKAIKCVAPQLLDMTKAERAKVMKMFSENYVKLGISAKTTDFYNLFCNYAKFVKESENKC